MSETAIVPADWTQGGDAIVYQSCRSCRAVWYFRRGFCPSCGATEPQTHRAGGKGIVHAVSLVCRAAMPEAKTHVPYMIVLVDMAEGFRVMAHGDKNLAIGDAVVLRLQTFTDRRVPYFEKV